MFWIALLVIGFAMVLFQLGALKVWVVVFQLALWFACVIAALLGLGFVWKMYRSKHPD